MKGVQEKRIYHGRERYIEKSVSRDHSLASRDKQTVILGTDITKTRLFKYIENFSSKN